MFQASTSTGMPPSAVTVSTSNIAPASWTSFGDFGNRLPGAGRCFGHDNADDFWLGRGQRRPEIVCGEDFAPRPLDFRDFRPGSLGHIDHPRAKDAVDANEHRIARLDQIDDGRFHARAAGAADGKRHRVLCAE